MDLDYFFTKNDPKISDNLDWQVLCFHFEHLPSGEKTKLKYEYNNWFHGCLHKFFHYRFANKLFAQAVDDYQYRQEEEKRVLGTFTGAYGVILFFKDQIIKEYNPQNIKLEEKLVKERIAVQTPLEREETIA